jgi:hypothetical protein
MASKTKTTKVDSINRAELGRASINTRDWMYKLADQARATKNFPLARVIQCALEQVGRAIETASDGRRRELFPTQAKMALLAVVNYGQDLQTALLPHRLYLGQ